jgi:hypothetical protein
MGRLLQLVPYPNDIFLQNVSLVGQGSAVDCLRDGTDASWVQMLSGAHAHIKTEMESPAIAGNERTTQGRWVMRWDTGNGNPDLYLHLVNSGDGAYFSDYENANRSGGLLTYAYPWHPLYIDQNQVTDLRLWFVDTDGGSTKARITAVHLEIETNYSPNAAWMGVPSGPQPETGPTEAVWGHNDPEGDEQTKAHIIIRRIDNGVDHWNEEIMGGQQTRSFSNYQFPPGDYYYYARTSDAWGYGPFSVNTFTIPEPNTAPTVTATGPTGTTTDTTPTITWNYSDLQGQSQALYEVHIFNQAQYSAGGFDPNTSAVTYSSGSVASSATSHTVASPLASDTYRAYVWVQDGILQGGPSYVQFAVNLPSTNVVTGPTGTVSTTFPVTWTYSDPEGNPQSAYCVKIFHESIYTVGGFDPEINPSALLDTGAVASAATSHSVTTTLVSGNCRAYVKTQDAGSGVFGPWSFITFVYNKRSTVVVSAPTGDIQNPSPMVQWNYSDPDNDVQTDWHVRIFNVAQYSVGGFDPTTSPATYNYGPSNNDALTSHLVGVELASDTYRTYVRTTDAGSAEFGAWAYAAFVLNRAAAILVTAPQGNISVRRPVVTWTYTDPEGNVQVRFRVKLITQAVYEGGSFNPETAVGAYDSGDITSAATTHNSTTELAKGNYRAYVKATDTATGTYTNWAQAPFTIQTHSHQMIL